MPARGPSTSDLSRFLEEKERREAGLRIACLGIAFQALAYYEEDCGRDAEVQVKEEEVIIIDQRGCCRDSIDAFQRSFPRIIRVPHRDCEIECSTDIALMGYRYSEISRQIAEIFLRAFRSILAEMASTGYEYFLLVGWNGEIAYGRGEETRIHLPLVPGVLMAHTHPSPICYPSGYDIRSAAEFFSSGGIVEAIVSPQCVSIMRLREPLSEDDYWRMIELGEKARRSRSGDEYLRLLNALSKLSTVVFEVF